MSHGRMQEGVSAVIPVHNGEAFLAEAVESVREQSVPVSEIIVVDDGSTDGTGALVERWTDVRLIRQEWAGPAAARNRGVRSAAGSIIGFLDADDLWPAGKLETQLSRLESDPAIEAVLGLTQVLRRVDLPGEAGTFEPLGSPWLAPLLGSGIYRRSLFERLGLFNVSLRHSEDTDWFLRMREEGVKVRIIEDVSLLYRQHGGNMTKDSRARNLGIVKALRLSLDRRRSHGGEAASLPGFTSFVVPRGGAGSRRGPGKVKESSEE